MGTRDPRSIRSCEWLGPTKLVNVEFRGTLAIGLWPLRACATQPNLQAPSILLKVLVREVSCVYIICQT